MQISISFDGREIDKKLNTLIKGVKDFKEPLESTGVELMKFYGEKVFASQGAEMGGKWKPLAPATLRMRARRQGHYAKPPIATGKILIWTGALKKGFKKTVTRTKLTIENTVKYFKFNQPNRPMLGINAKVIEIVLKNFRNYLEKLTK